MTAPVLIEARCARCAKRLLDYVNNIATGSIRIKKRCRHCGAMNDIMVQGASAEK